MSVWDDFIRRLEQDLAECRSDLELLESGRMQNRERRNGGAWVDTTQRELDWHKKTIGMYEGLVRKLRAEHGGGDLYRERVPTIRLRHTRRVVHAKAQGRTTTAALSPLCDCSGGDPVRRRGTSGRAHAGCLDAGR